MSRNVRRRGQNPRSPHVMTTSAADHGGAEIEGRHIETVSHPPRRPRAWVRAVRSARTPRSPTRCSTLAAARRGGDERRRWGPSRSSRSWKRQGLRSTASAPLTAPVPSYVYTEPAGEAQRARLEHIVGAARRDGCARRPTRPGRGRAPTDAGRGFCGRATSLDDRRGWRRERSAGRGSPAIMEGRKARPRDVGVHVAAVNGRARRAGLSFACGAICATGERSGLFVSAFMRVGSRANTAARGCSTVRSRPAK